MFVCNCKVITDELLKIPLDNLGKKKGKKKKKKNNTSDKAMDVDSEEQYNPVRCDQCNTEVGVYDKDEIYHFFNVLASYT